jgi:glyoxylase-like metal-dependent hydrolase (beta-lactamase superfamily II)
MHAEDFNPVPGKPDQIAPGLQRVLAPNPGPMTWRGTNTYLLGTRGVAVIDPGPDDPAHLDAILGALGPHRHVSHIFVTHAHIDHAPLARTLSAHTGAPVLAYGDAGAGRSDVMLALVARGLLSGGEGVDTGFRPDRALSDGAETVGDGWTLTAHWTPGHMGNHMVFAWQDAVFSGDLVMGWSSSLVSPPDGDMTDFMASCVRLHARAPRVLYPGHGAPVRRPAERIAELVAHRRAREAALLAALAEGPGDLARLTERVYGDLASVLIPAAQRNTLAHLVDLHKRGAICAAPDLQDDAVFALVRKDDKKTSNASGRS